MCIWELAPLTALTQSLSPSPTPTPRTETCASRLTKDLDGLTLILSPHTSF